jgi:iron complex outermembrane recepter protein
VNAKVDGAIFSLPAGAVRLALGSAFRRETYDGYQNTGRFNQADSLGLASAERKVVSAYAELFVPVFSDEKSVPGFARLDLSLSGRYDDYNDFGDTTNPKYGLNWSPIESLTFRASYGTSYHAPALPDLSGPDSRAQFVANAPIGPPGTGPLNSFILAGSNAELQPETATTRSYGIDFRPRDVLAGFNASATYYSIDFEGLIDFPRGNLYLDPYYIQFAYYQPTPAQVEELIAGMRVVGVSRPFPVIGQVLDLRRKNLGLVSTDGIDLELSYRWSTSLGEWLANVSGNHVLNYDTKASPLSPTTDQFERGLPETSLRGSFSSIVGRLRANVAVNYTTSYQQQYVTTTNLTQLETVGSFTTVELHFGYELGTSGALSGTHLLLDVENLLDEEPPLTRSATGNLGLATSGGVGTGNPFGRVISIGLSKEW